MNITIHTMPEIIAAGLVLIAALLIIAKVIKNKTVHLRSGGKEAVLRPDELPCVQYVTEHSIVLAGLETSMREIKDILRVHGEEIRALYVVEKSVLTALDVLLGLAEGDEINGQVRKARSQIAVAQVAFDEATIGKVGTV
jgi:hypothetical protein